MRKNVKVTSSANKHNTTLRTTIPFDPVNKVATTEFVRRSMADWKELYDKHVHLSNVKYDTESGRATGVVKVESKEELLKVYGTPQERPEYYVQMASAAANPLQFFVTQYNG
jgi:hypothetical protein